MKTVLIHGQSHEGSTCQIGRILARKLGGEVTEFFLPRDFGEFCVGCTACFTKTETKCPHYRKLKPITDAIDEADVMIFASPVYVYHVTGAMKTLLDHYGYRWMVHRPEERMFSKQAVVISTAAGAGTRSTNRDMADSLFFWGCGKIYKLGFGIAATSWTRVKPKVRAKIERKTTALANKIRKQNGRAKPGLKTKGFFAIMRILQKGGLSEADRSYWEEKGWLGRKRPWKGN
ncbi:MAG: NAD(P)H-dependent oxidoreductase [Eubacteriales bacterium]|nr:NAD(P)H-dependent oxidoreductase [Eubacteriales bacterium]